MTLKDIFLEIKAEEIDKYLGHPLVLGENHVVFAKDETAFTICQAMKRCCKRGMFYSSANDEEESWHKQMVTDQLIMASEDMLKRALRLTEDEQEQQRILNMILNCDCLPDGVDQASKLQFAIQAIHSLMQNCKRSIE